MDSILILDFGGQTTQLISRRIRDFGVYSEIAPGNCALKNVLKKNIKGIILSGSPHSAWDSGTPRPDASLFESGLPVLGICYGFHVLTHTDHGEVRPLSHREYGRSQVSHTGGNALFNAIPHDFSSWMSHGDSIARLGKHYSLIAESENGSIAAAAHQFMPYWGVQFHPEADHCEYGSVLLENFVCGICGAHKQWSMERYVDSIGESIRKKVGERDVLLLISGGVDSTVVAALLLKVLPKKQVWLMYVDTGMMRKNESEEVTANLRLLGVQNLLCIDAKEHFLQSLSGIADPEQKRKIIGDTFIRVQEDATTQHLPNGYLLAQGTLYTDLVESGCGVGSHTHVIKSHHNVGTPLVLAKRDAEELIEPLDKLYKDEVRRLGEVLKVSESILYRHPFPGPGLAIRILSEITEEKIGILREADALYIEELKKRGLYSEIWQAFSILLPVRSVGVAGDERNYGYVLALRAVVSRDGMTADVYDFPMDHLRAISAKITNRIQAIGRVVYDISSKPPATIEWE